MDAFNPMLQVSIDLDDPSVAETKRMFDRVLASWASDLLLLRRQGLTAPGWRVRVEDDDETTWRRAA
ncbi:MAG: hypothetical protein CMJ52_10360 [Planctomycetaceae bacterium]|nr:hypothetical protein [Planctomycetaceae bacterium]